MPLIEDNNNSIMTKSGTINQPLINSNKLFITAIVSL